MIVVADTGPLHYLVLIGAVDVLQPLYSRVLVPQTVAGELQETNTPAAVRAWIEQPPEWFEIRPDPPSEETLRFLDPGERAAIALALSVDAERPGEHAMSSSAAYHRMRHIVIGYNISSMDPPLRLGFKPRQRPGRHGGHGDAQPKRVMQRRGDAVA
jgi:hypothetical protein